jgi:hypothetical protein
LERAIEEVTKEMATIPPNPKKPAYPNRAAK